MSKFNKEKVMPRYFLIAVILSVVGVAVVAKAAYIMTAEKEYWTDVASRLVRDSLEVRPNRGNILSSDGQLMASSIPQYKMYMDFQTGGLKRDSVLFDSLDYICDKLHYIFPEKSADDFKKHILRGHAKMDRHWPIWSKRVDYNTFQQVKSLPVFSMSKYKGGFHYEEFNARTRPFGSLASRTIGNLYGAKDSALCGLELAYDSLLRGMPGIAHRRKVLDKYMTIQDVAPIDGYDILTTIDVDIQDLAERALIEELKDPQVHGDVGVAIVMEVATGDIKAMVNMTKGSDGEYYEMKNAAISNLLEPGSVFKTASIMVALDDGVVDTTYTVDTGSGVYNMYGRDMKDHNWRRGGYQVISLPRTLEVSSNIGVSRIIDEHYHNNPEKFVEGIYRIGLASDLSLPLAGSTPPRIRMPQKNSHGQYTNWSNTALAWMSIGYETQVPPISTLTFYNAIANDGKMVKPRFVTAAMRNGVVEKTFPVEVIKERICKEKTLKEMQTILEHVVSQGLGKKAGSKSFKVAGKTGTAQISQGAGGYKTGVTQYLLSFAGYFPADDPLYSCIVCIQKSGLPASGGGMSGLVFHNIAEGIMSNYMKMDISDACDNSDPCEPEVKSGNIMSANYVLDQLGLSDIALDTNSYPYGVEWANQMLTTMPDVRGMGARDAVFLLEHSGISTTIKGRGKVKRQSIIPGSSLQRGLVCNLEME